MKTPSLLLLTGKGGTGKTTAAAALALALAGRGERVTVISLDPAHNLGDVLGHTLGPGPEEVHENLRALEADLAGRSAAKTSQTRRLVEQRYHYLSVANLDPLIRLLGDAPGAEEHAAAEELGERLRDSRIQGRTLIVDLPPSGQAWRMLTLPELTARWCRSLIALRGKILDRRRTLDSILGEESPARVPGGGRAPSRPEEDPVLLRLEAALALHGELAAALTDRAECRLLAVALPERLSLLETKRLRERLAGHGIFPGGLIINCCPEDTRALVPFAEAFPNLPRTTLPFLDQEPRGESLLLPLGERLLPLVRP